MKFLILAMLSLASISSYASCNREAQFMGTVTDVKVVAATADVAEHHTFKIELGFRGHFFFEPSIVCPLDVEELSDATISVAGLPTKANGDSIVGILVFDQENQSYKIE